MTNETYSLLEMLQKEEFPISLLRRVQSTLLSSCSTVVLSDHIVSAEFGNQEDAKLRQPSIRDSYQSFQSHVHHSGNIS